MKIAVNTRFLIDNKLEGLGLYTHEVLSRMVKSHPSDEFYFLFDRKFDSSYIYADNVTGIVVNPPARHPILWWLWFEIMIPRTLKRIEADVFLSLDGYNSLSTNVPSTLVIHDLAFLHYGQFVPYLVNKYYRFFTPKYIKRAEQIICVSNATKKDIQFHYKTPWEKLTVGYNGCRKEFHKHTLNEIQHVRKKYTNGDPYFLFVGAIHPRKNVVKMMKAFDLFKNQTGLAHKLLIVGRKAWHNKEMEQAYEETKFKKEILFTGYLDLKDLVEVTASAFSLLYVSLFEGFGVPLIEAMNSDVPIIASNCSSIPEVVGEAAIIVDPNDLGQIVKAMVTLVTDPQVGSNLIEQGKLQLKNFNWDDTADTIYERLTKSLR